MTSVAADGRRRPLRTALWLLIPTRLAAAAWALVSLASVRRRLDADDLRALWVAPPPPGLPDIARRGVDIVLRRAGATCLQRSLILQAWDRAHGTDRAVVVGVTAPRQGFRAHAWIDGESGCDTDTQFTELLRLEP